jgi:hypothetical protein
MMIGTIIQLQVQRSSLKVASEDGRYYDPAPIRRVPVIELDPCGVVGRDEAGNAIIDVHHRDHPQSKNRDLNGISIGFVTHYDLMRQRIGDHLLNGLAGENILVQTDDIFTESDLPEKLAIETIDGRLINLVGVQVAEPCVEFTRFTLRYAPAQRPDKAVTNTLDFLRRGMRGYYATYLDAPAIVRVGDRLVVPLDSL